MKELLADGNIVLLDDEDYEKLKNQKWHCVKGYAVRNKKINGRNKMFSMHREIMNAPKGLVVDHINGNPLDNRKSNLRLVTNQQNIFNSGKHKAATSAYKGVAWNKQANCWQTAIECGSKSINVGHFEYEFDAAVAYNMMALKLFGEYARLNPVPLNDEWEQTKRKKSSKSSFRGVTWHENEQKWMVRIYINKKRIQIGYFTDEIEAARAYELAAIKYKLFDRIS